MMRRTLLRLLPVLAPGLAHAQDHPTVWLRVRNHSQEVFEHVWQGLPRTRSNVDLGPLRPGQTSRWHAVPATLAHYRKTRIQLAQRQLTDVTDTSFPQGRATLEPGRYTFAYTLEGDALRLTVIPEAETTEPDRSHQKQ